MTSASRLSSTGNESLRAPYAAPQPGAIPPEPSAADRKLAPFIPREHRGAFEVSVLTSQMPTVELSESDAAVQLPIAESVVDLPWAGVAGPIAESVTDLPWIEAFVHDNVVDSDSDGVPEDNWPMGEAAKRLDELTESLTSIDAGRALLHPAEQPHREHSSSIAADAHTVWNDDEWMDIMPTNPAILPAADRLQEPAADNVYTEWNDAPEAAERAYTEWTDATEADGTSIESDSSATAHTEGESGVSPQAQPDSANMDFAESQSVGYQHAEASARALERLAERVRAGEVPVPAIQQDLGDAAVLAGVLAALLGWRR